MARPDEAGRPRVCERATNPVIEVVGPQQHETASRPGRAMYRTFAAGRFY
ncbi:MAG: hypothetical protein K8R59_02845 [Thermoanaerobaculales bacterium]|nr:hypothetical protein [Thermoanaerobaculales bacterium]